MCRIEIVATALPVTAFTMERSDEFFNHYDEMSIAESEEDFFPRFSGGNLDKQRRDYWGRGRANSWSRNCGRKPAKFRTTDGIYSQSDRGLRWSFRHNMRQWDEWFWNHYDAHQYLEHNCAVH